jgi:hypothetical protein
MRDMHEIDHGHSVYWAIVARIPWADLMAEPASRMLEVHFLEEGSMIARIET